MTSSRYYYNILYTSFSIGTQRVLLETVVETLRKTRWIEKYNKSKHQ